MVTHQSWVWSCWKSVCWWTLVCSSERWQTPPWCAHGCRTSPLSVGGARDHVYREQGVWRVWFENVIKDICSCSEQTFSSSLSGACLSPAAAMYVLPMVLIFSTEQNLGLERSWKQKSAVKDTDLMWHGGMFNLLPHTSSKSDMISLRKRIHSSPSLLALLSL